MTPEELINLAVAVAPSVTAIASILGVSLKLSSNFKKVSQAVDNTGEELKRFKESKELKDLKSQIGRVVQENYELKKQLNELVCRLNHVKVSKDVKDNKKQ